MSWGPRTKETILQCSGTVMRTVAQHCYPASYSSSTERKTTVALTSPSNPRGNGGTTTEMGKQLEATAFKSELNPLLSLLHNDHLKLAKLTNNDAAIKVTDPVLLAKIKTSQLNTNLEDLLPWRQSGRMAHRAFPKVRKRRDGDARVQDAQGLPRAYRPSGECFCAIAMETKIFSAQCETIFTITPERRKWTTSPWIGWLTKSQRYLTSSSCTRIRNMPQWTDRAAVHSRCAQPA